MTECVVLCCVYIDRVCVYILYRSRGWCTIPAAPTLDISSAISPPVAAAAAAAAAVLILTVLTRGGGVKWMDGGINGRINRLGRWSYG